MQLTMLQYSNSAYGVVQKLLRHNEVGRLSMVQKRAKKEPTERWMTYVKALKNSNIIKKLYLKKESET